MLIKQIPDWSIRVMHIQLKCSKEQPRIHLNLLSTFCKICQGNFHNFFPVKRQKLD